MLTKVESAARMRAAQECTMNPRSGGRHIALRNATLGVLALAMAGCASVAPRSAEDATAPARDRPSSRAEQVFLYQSRVADALLDRYPLLDMFREADPRLVMAEARMTEVCGPLTQAVLSRLEGREPPLMLRFQVMYTTGDCERAARRIERLLRAADSRAAAAGPSI